MSNGHGPVGQVPATVVDYSTEPHDTITTDAKLSVGCWWTSAESGAELRVGALDAEILLDDDAALELAKLLFRAAQPAKMPDNGFERWVERVRAAAEDVIARAERDEDEPSNPDPLDPPDGAEPDLAAEYERARRRAITGEVTIPPLVSRPHDWPHES